jgi:hypothetical protein
MYPFRTGITRLVTRVCAVYETDQHNSTSTIRLLRENIQYSLSSLDQGLLALAFRLVPLNPTAARSAALQHPFKAGFSPLSHAFLVASMNLQHALDSCVGHVVEETNRNL